MQQVTDVFNRGVLQKIIPGLVIISSEDLLDRLLEIRKIHHHSILECAFNDTFDLIRMAVGNSAFGMTGEGMGAIDMVYDADLHYLASGPPS